MPTSAQGCTAQPALGSRPAQSPPTQTSKSNSLPSAISSTNETRSNSSPKRTCLSSTPISSLMISTPSYLPLPTPSHPMLRLVASFPESSSSSRSTIPSRASEWRPPKWMIAPPPRQPSQPCLRLSLHRRCLEHLHKARSLSVSRCSRAFLVQAQSLKPANLATKPYLEARHDYRKL